MTRAARRDHTTRGLEPVKRDIDRLMQERGIDVAVVTGVVKGNADDVLHGERRRDLVTPSS